MVIYETSLIIGLSIIGFCLLYLSSSMKKNHPFLQIPLIVLSFFLFIANFNLMYQVALVGGYTAIATTIDSLYITSVWFSVFIVGYIMLWMLASILKHLGRLKNDKLIDDF